ncbi:unnamed protein product [Caenorhabditis angaria]|uniref:Uncharacterized protein n=1 Tax=Caenorhabditis angaria TaxID=860376 RepID=A0A9P1I7X4_9PELO|nr:unnamed protein product [Caenorhabditis angaria]
MDLEENNPHESQRRQLELRLSQTYLSTNYRMYFKYCQLKKHFSKFRLNSSFPPDLHAHHSEQMRHVDLTILRIRSAISTLENHTIPIGD